MLGIGVALAQLMVVVFFPCTVAGQNAVAEEFLFPNPLTDLFARGIQNAPVLETFDHSADRGKYEFRAAEQVYVVSKNRLYRGFFDDLPLYCGGVGSVKSTLMCGGDPAGPIPTLPPGVLPRIPCADVPASPNYKVIQALNSPGYLALATGELLGSQPHVAVMGKDGELVGASPETLKLDDQNRIVGFAPDMIIVDDDGRLLQSPKDIVVLDRVGLPIEKSQFFGTIQDCRKDQIPRSDDPAPPAFPFVVGLMSASANNIQCSGSIIGPKTILTAAHCTCTSRLSTMFYGSSIFPGEVPEPAFFMPLTGEVKLLDPDFCSAQANAAAAAGPDLALVYISADTQITPITFAPATGDLFDRIETMVGFGASIFEFNGGQKRYAKVDARKCATKDEAATYGCNVGSEVFAKNSAAGDFTDFCRGDSGGPVLVPFNSSEYLLAAVLSRRIKDSETEYCGSGGISVDVSSDKVRQWIEANVR